MGTRISGDGARLVARKKALGHGIGRLSLLVPAEKKGSMLTTCLMGMSERASEPKQEKPWVLNHGAGASTCSIAPSSPWVAYECDPRRGASAAWIMNLRVFERRRKKAKVPVCAIAIVILQSGLVANIHMYIHTYIDTCVWYKGLGAS